MGEITRIFPYQYVVDDDIAVPPKRRGRPPVKPITLTSGMTLDIVKYPNRRLYSSALHRYVSLEDVGYYWDRGIVIRACMARDRSIDITVQVLMDMLLQRVIAGKLKVSEAQLRELAERERNHDLAERLRYIAKYLDRPGTDPREIVFSVTVQEAADLLDDKS